tara:strand:+ start:822 stop:1484 length:663 start_codon:yes stop_codon:yes gene_type:complete
MTYRTLSAVSAAALIAATPVLAQTQAQVATDLNLRVGPGENYVIKSTLPAEAMVDVSGCVEGGSWCEVTYEDETGYAYAPYLVVTEEEQMVALPSATVTTVETVTYDESNNGDEAFIGGSAGAAIAATAIGGPAAIVGGVLIGSALGAAAGVEVKEETVTYVQQNPIQPIYVQGEVVTGATLPAEVTLVPVQDGELAYVNLNGSPVLVNPENRTIVRIVR